MRALYVRRDARCYGSASQTKKCTRTLYNEGVGITELEFRLHTGLSA